MISNTKSQQQQQQQQKKEWNELKQFKLNDK